MDDGEVFVPPFFCQPIGRLWYPLLLGAVPGIVVAPITSGYQYDPVQFSRHTGEGCLCSCLAMLPRPSCPELLEPSRSRIRGGGRKAIRKRRQRRGFELISLFP
jgi:hypothetical protein